MRARLGWGLALTILCMLAACGPWVEPYRASRPAPDDDPATRPDCVPAPDKVGVYLCGEAAAAASSSAPADPATRSECRARPDTTGVYDCTPVEHPASGSYGYTPAPSGGGPVHVRGYYRRDGTYVRPHTRRRPH